MAEIPEDIFIGILLRLPAKSLVRFKCVSKRWRSLISDPGFVKSHLQRLKAGDLLIASQRIFIANTFCPLPPSCSRFATIDYEALDESEGGRVVVPHSTKPSWNPKLVVGSCDGLVCVLFASFFLIYNPTTRESRELPRSILFHRLVLFRGFGYDSRSDDYKIVEGSVKDENWKVAILSLKSGSWRKTKAQIERGSHAMISGKGVYWNGALHWCHSELFSFPGGEWPKVEKAIMSFDLSEEKFHQELPVPEVDGDIDFIGLGIHGASLFIHNSIRDPCFEAWIMDEYGRGGSWTKWFSVDCIPALRYLESPLACTRSGKIVIQLDVNRMILFNPEDNTCKDYPIGRERERDGIFKYAIYLETLVSPYLDDEPSSP